MQQTFRTPGSRGHPRSRHSDAHGYMCCFSDDAIIDSSTQLAGDNIGIGPHNASRPNICGPRGGGT